ncbi:MAG: glycosyltransferase [Candidatus Binataceae bacterium]
MLVSVIIPVFNGAATVAAAIDSALAQKFDGEFEVIVVNDGSTDSTAEVLRGYGDRIKVVTQENRGAAAARNACVRNSSGQYLAFLDADDEWREDKLAKTVAALDAHAEAGMVYTDATLIDESGKVVAANYIPDTHAREPSFDELLREWWYVLPSTVVMRRSILDRCGGFEERFGRCRYGEDAYIWLLAREIAPFRLIPSPLVRYRVATVREHHAKREAARGGSDPAPGEQADPHRYVHGELVFERLLRERYGRRAKPLIRRARASQASLLESIGLSAMARSEAALARRCYLVSIQRKPLRTRIWMRFVWALMPRRVRRVILALLPLHLARAVEGPPYDPLEERQTSPA